jgi:hypothetical protein
MPQRLEGPALALVESQDYCVVATRRADGEVRTVVAWVGLEDGRLLLNSVEGRGWLEDLRRSGAATVTVVNFENPGEYVSIGARLAGATHEDAVAVTNRLSNAILGIDYPLFREDEQRVAVRLDPERVSYFKLG